MRLGQPTTSLAYREWYQCRRKQPYLSRAEAEESADWQETPASRPMAYDCEWCGAIHLGRERRRAKNRLWPSAKTLRVRADVAMIEMLGDRAYWNGHTESTGTRSQRLAVLAARLRVIEKRQARLVVPEGETT